MFAGMFLEEVGACNVCKDYGIIIVEIRYYFILLPPFIYIIDHMCQVFSSYTCGKNHLF